MLGVNLTGIFYLSKAVRERERGEGRERWERGEGERKIERVKERWERWER